MKEAATEHPRTEGLDPHDQQRAASLADEGGSSGATIEAEEERAFRNTALAGGIAAIAGASLAFLAFRFLRR